MLLYQLLRAMRNLPGSGIIEECSACLATQPFAAFPAESDMPE